MTNRVFVLGTNRVPLAPCHPARARELLRKGKAAVFRMYPFTLILKRNIPQSQTGRETLTVKIDPGSRTTGLAITLRGKYSIKCVFGLNLVHRGISVVGKLISRSQQRRGRRSRNCRYRKPRFLNRAKPNGWLPPSLVSRISNVKTWIDRFMRFCRISKSSIEVVSFDTQKMQNSDISGKEYQQGTLLDFKVKEYLLYRYNHTCQYCSGVSKDPVLEREHIHPSSKGGSNRVSNLTLACRTCNSAKSTLVLSEWLTREQSCRSPLSISRVKGILRVQKGLKPPLRDTVAATLVSQCTVSYLNSLGLNPDLSPGYITKYNRSTLGYRKDHWIDAACVGSEGPLVAIPSSMLGVVAKAQKCNNRQMCCSDKYGFPRTKAKGPSKVFGFKTGDIVKSVVLKGKYKGTHVGKVSVRNRGNFNIFTAKGKNSANHKTCTSIHNRDGYSYVQGTVGKLTVLMRKGNKLKEHVKDKYKIISVKSIDSYSLQYNLNLV